MSRLVLVLNCGSSSIKFALFDVGRSPLPRAPIWGGKVNGITGETPRYEESGSPSMALAPTGSRPYDDALGHIRTRVEAQLDGRGLAAVAHRVVHGGPKYFRPTRVDAAVLADLKDCIPLAPLHQPYALEVVEALLDAAPELPQIACFDTAFHHTLPMVEQIMPLPWEAWERGLRRYGFHGLSYQFQSIALAERYGNAARGRTIVAHLGSGASLCAMRGLQSVATSMGFSALDGLMMGTRCGALDPGAVLFLMQIDKLSVEEVSDMLYHRSGLLGVSGVSSDPRELLPLEAGNPRVQVALELYVQRIVREIGALAATLGGLDMLVFTGGVGEHNHMIRERVCSGLGFLGVTIDETSNRIGERLLSPAEQPVTVAVEATNEEWIAALDCASVLEPVRATAKREKHGKAPSLQGRTAQ